jgi:hypothetical protein
MTVTKGGRNAEAQWGALGSRETDCSEVFRHRQRGEMVSPHVHVEPAPRVPDYEEIARLVSRPQPPTVTHIGRNRDDAGRRNPVPER